MVAMADFIDLRVDKLSGLGRRGFALSFILAHFLDGSFIRHGVPPLQLNAKELNWKVIVRFVLGADPVVQKGIILRKRTQYVHHLGARRSVANSLRGVSETSHFFRYPLHDVEKRLSHAMVLD